jgi:hypothetical protein
MRDGTRAPRETEITRARGPPAQPWEKATPFQTRKAHGCLQRRPSEVLVCQTMKDLVAGSGLTFEDRGKHELKGVPERWRLYKVAAR